MADRGAARRVARASITGADGERWIQTFQGDLYVRDTFERADGALGSPEVGGTAWNASNMAISGGTAARSATGSTVGALTDTGRSDDVFLSWTLGPNTATPATAQGATSCIFRSQSTFGETSGNARPSNGWVVRYNPSGLTAEDRWRLILFVNRAEYWSANADTAPPYNQAGSALQVVEVRLSGTNIQVWVNGVNTHNVVSDAFQTDTYAGVGMNSSSANTAIPLRDFFVTELPSAPGAVDIDQIDTWDLAPVAAGAEVPCHVRWCRIGAPLLNSPTVIHHQFVQTDFDNTNQTVIRGSGAVAVSADEGYLDYSTGWYATSQGLSTDPPRSGQFRVRAYQASGTDWTIDSERDTTPPTGSTTDRGAGYLVASDALASVSVPSAAGDPDAAHGETISVGFTLGATPFPPATAPTIDIIQNGAVLDTEAPAFSGATATSTDVVDNTFTAAVDGVGVRFTAANVTNSEPSFVFTSAPAGYRLAGTENHIVESSSDGLALTEDAFTVDPRITVVHHKQSDSNLLDPAKDDDAKERLPGIATFVGFRLRNAKGGWLNGITATETLRDANSLFAAAVNRSVTTATVNTHDGSSELIAWDSSEPRGAWNHVVEITAPATATGASHLLEGTETFTLLLKDPRLQPVVEGVSTKRKGHFVPGDTLKVDLKVLDKATGELSTLDETAGNAPYVIVTRSNHTTGHAEFLDSDLSWKQMNGVVAYAWPLTKASEAIAGGSTQVWTATFADTSGFSYDNLVLVGNCKIDGTPYSVSGSVVVTGKDNSHDGYEIDAVALALHGVIGNR